MKIIVFSDSHGDTENMYRAVARVCPDRIIHLGDGWHDAGMLSIRCPSLPLDRVPGNCDLGAGSPAERLLLAEGKRILICHGHTLHVKTGLLSALYAAQERQADALLFGHTHRPMIDCRGGVWLMNPGSIGSPSRPTYGVLEIRGGSLLPSIFEL